MYVGLCPPKPLTNESDTEGSDSPVAAAKLPDITASVNVVDLNRVEGKTWKRQTSVDGGDVMELTYKKERGFYQVKVLKFFRSRVTKTQKRDANGKTVGTKTLGGDLMVNIEWLDAPAYTVSTVIG